MTGPFFDIKTDADKTAVALKEVGENRLSSWVRYALTEEAHDYILFVQKNYLSGQKLDFITGQTAGSVKAWSPKSGRKKGLSDISVRVRPGVGIKGSKNYLGRWAGTSREFMQPAFSAFSAGNRIENAIDGNIELMLRKVFNEK